VGLAVVAQMQTSLVPLARQVKATRVEIKTVPTQAVVVVVRVL
jgi:hypothetical protein